MCLGGRRQDLGFRRQNRRVWGCLERSTIQNKDRATTRERLGTLNTGWAVFVVRSASFPGPHVTFPLSVCKRGYRRWLTP